MRPRARGRTRCWRSRKSARDRAGRDDGAIGHPSDGTLPPRRGEPRSQPRRTLHDDAARISPERGPPGRLGRPGGRSAGHRPRGQARQPLRLGVQARHREGLRQLLQPEAQRPGEVRGHPVGAVPPDHGDARPRRRDRGRDVLQSQQPRALVRERAHPGGGRPARHRRAQEEDDPREPRQPQEQGRHQAPRAALLHEPVRPHLQRADAAAGRHQGARQELGRAGRALREAQARQDQRHAVPAQLEQ